MQKHSAEVVVIGAGIAGLVTALELAKNNKKVIVVDTQAEEECGGLANVAFGGMALVDTPEQRSRRIKDSPELALEDWLRYAELGSNDTWPRQWAEYYVQNTVTEVYEYIRALDVKFIPSVNWAERGEHIIGNSVPRYHILWGCSLYLIKRLLLAMKPFVGKQIEFHFNTRISNLITENSVVTGCRNDRVEYMAEAVVVATGGFGGNIDIVRQYWPTEWPKLTQTILNGNHPSNDGHMHQQARKAGAVLKNMHNMWNYAAGIDHPQPKFPNHGLSLIPCRSALWVDHLGKRIMPPMIGGLDTQLLCQRVNELQIPHSWQILNRRIALKELAISGSEHNPTFRDRSYWNLIKDLIRGNRWLVDKMCDESEEFIVANSIEELVAKMQKLNPEYELNSTLITQQIRDYDSELRLNDKSDDYQVQTINNVREYMVDKLRTAPPRPISDDLPFIAIRLRLVTRKSMGGITTNMQSQVLNVANQVIPGLYAVGEAAGFGGGGCSGKRSLEGTFLSGCIMTARQAARSLS